MSCGPATRLAGSAHVTAPPPPDISLIVSWYNQAAWTALALSSAMHQRVSVPFEILVCDDGSGDDGFERLRRLTATTDVDVRYLWQPDRGFRLSRSRNNGIRCARGRILVFVDGDCWLAPTFLDDHWRAQQAAPSIVCGLRYTLTLTDAELADLAIEGLETVAQAPQREHLWQQHWILSASPWMACLGGNFSVPASPAVIFDERFQSWGSEDRDLALRLYRTGLRPRLLDRSNVVQVRITGSPWVDPGHDSAVALLHNKRLLHAKYPAGELRASVALVKLCHLDAHTQRWSIGRCRSVSVEEVLQEFEQWLARSAAAGG